MLKDVVTGAQSCIIDGPTTITGSNDRPLRAVSIFCRVRESLGLCPQHNMLFENLTVREHFIFFGMVSLWKDLTPRVFHLQLVR
jgi:hypothetical protein